MLFLQGDAGMCNNYLLSLLRDMMEAQGMFVGTGATTGIAASLYKNGRTLYNFPGIGVDNKDASERHARLSKHGPRFQRAEPISY